MFVPLARGKFTSIACAELDCSGFAHLPPAHILFSLATFPIQVQPLPFAELTSSVLSLGQSTWAMFDAWKAREDNGQLAAVVSDLQVQLKRRIRNTST